ncbi:MAG: HAD family hydrolase [Betaproteobacteria bacterium]|nr:HAD family hydrolase [Betaproteobacteria bacterium]
MKLALFDLDNTLLDGDSDYCWAQYLIERGVLERAEFEKKNDWFYHHYKQGTLDIHEYLAFQLRPIAGRPREEIDAWHRDFMEKKIRPIVHAKTPALLAAHHGALRAIVTATNRFITAPIAVHLGVDHLIACDVEEGPDGRLTGRAVGTPSFREGKITRLEEWLAGLGHRLGDFEESWFYSDSLNDLPLLEKVTNPVAVDPDPTLERQARDRGWPILRLRA